MSTSNAPVAGKPTASLIDEAALNFVSTPKYFKLLEQYRAAVLNLRARDASYVQIQDLLKKYRVFVSEPAIARFCRKYRDELQRIRLLLERETEESPEPPTAAKPTAPISNVNTTPNPIAPTPHKMRDLRGDF
jgi:hypothetical protein